MKKQLTPEQRKERFELILKSVGLLGVCIVLGPLFFTILNGLGALAALFTAGAAVFTVTKFLPWFAMKISNLRLKAIKNEAMKNPVETLQNQYVEKQKALDSFRESIKIFAGKVANFGDKVKQYVKQNMEDHEVYVEQLNKMKQLLSLRQEKYKEASIALESFAETIKRTDIKWQMACEATAMNEAAGQFAGDVFDKICIETALNAVQDKLNQSFADLEIALLDDDKEKAKQMYSEKIQKATIVPTVDIDNVVRNQTQNKNKTA